MRGTLLVGTIVLTGPCLGAAGGSAAEDPPKGPPASAKTWRVAAGPQYQAGFLYRVLFGSGYRKLWATPILVEVLDLNGFSGGLTPLKKGGGKQTRGLKFKGGDGREWRFRSIDKDPSAVLPKALQHGFVDRIVQDQISASHPGNSLTVDALADAAGIPHVNRRIVVLPDDPRLGEFRSEFAGMLGTIEENASVKPPVTPGFEAFSDLVDTKELTALLDSDPRQRVDARAFLKARLFDVWIGDYDRHQGQWDWGKHADTGLWSPVPQDRDLAFVKFDGLVMDLVRPSQPRLVDFEDEYPSIVGITWQARFLDRRFLAELDWPEWREIAAELQGRLSDASIDEAVRRLPAPYYQLDGRGLAARLKARRRQLPLAARRFYEILAREAELHRTDEPDSVQLLRHADGAVDVVAAGPDAQYFRRRFNPSDTKEVRVFLKDGDDRAVSEGTGRPGVKVRLVGGDGNDVLDDSAGGHTRFYDSSGENRVIEGPGTRTDKRPYVAPLDATGLPMRDWGGSTLIVPVIRAGENLGVVVGAELRRTGYGFRKHPYGHQHRYQVAYSTRIKSFRFVYDYESLRMDNRSRFEVFARVSDLEQTRFHGFGNETKTPGSEGFYDVRQRQFALAPAYRLDLTPCDVRIGPVAKYADTRLSIPSLLAAEMPYGADQFGQVGARLGLTIDRRDHPRATANGALFSAEGNYYPRLWSVEEHFGEAHGTAAVYATAPIPLEPTLALRAGGKKVWGRYPFHEAAYIGGATTVRGLPRQRYMGDASAFGNAELRLRLFGHQGALGTRFGIFGLADVGRVFLKEEVSDRWHTAFGGGLWLSVVKPENTVSVSVAESEGRTRIYLEGGFMF